MVPTRARPITCPSCQKYWYADMTGELLTRKPWTSSCPFPPTQTVAAKLSRSRPAACVVLIPQAGSGTRSGSADSGGFVIAAAADSLARAAGCRFVPPMAAQQPVPFTTFMTTVAEAWAGGMPNSRV